MGKITGDQLEDVKVKVKRGQGQTVCGAEVVGFLACLDANNSNETQCAVQRKALFECMELAVRSGVAQRRHKQPVNHHIRTVRAPHPPAVLRLRLLLLCLCLVFGRVLTRVVLRAPPQFLRSLGGASRKVR